MNLLKKLFSGLFSTSAAGLYILLFAVSIGVATFVENDFGTSSAQKVIFKTHWFELILVLFGISLIVNIFRFRMMQQKKWATLTFHASMVIILIGAGVTRYFGSEGMMNIREGSASNSFLSAETYLQFQVLHHGKRYSFDEPVLFATLGDNHLKRSYMLGNQELNVDVQRFMPNPKEGLVEDANGVPIIKVVIGGMNGREEFLVKHLDKVNIYGTLFNFGNPEDPAAFNIKYEDKNLTFKAPTPFAQMVMATQKRDTLAPGVYHPLMLRSMYSNGEQSFVFGDFKPNAKSEITSSSRKMISTSTGGLDIKLSLGGEERNLFVVGSQGVEGRPGVVSFGNTDLAVAYGAKRVVLPFAIKLRDFIMERYPGTNSASSYASEVTLMDNRSNVARDQRIYMNHILDYDGYRFFQSSYDQDELGTYLSVNYDAPGTLISYIGYFLLTLGMVLTLLSKNSRFQQLGENIKRMRQSEKKFAVFLVACFLGFSTPGYCDPPAPNRLEVSAEHARRFGRILVQDYKGRFKPMNTFANEMLRKIARKEELLGQTAVQVILGMANNPKDWYDVPIIKVGKQEDIRKLLQISGEMASYNDFFDQNGDYKLREAVRKASNGAPRDRGVFEKELVKVDERVNICSMIFSGRFMKVFPVPGDTTNTWLSPDDAPHQHNTTSGGTIIEKFYPMYIPALQDAVQSNDWDLVNRMVGELDQYQQKYGGAILPSKSTVTAELLLNKLNIFSRLTGLYGLLGLSFLILLFTSVFKPKSNLQLAGLIAFWLLAFGFLMHSFGLGLRWYISGRAPWSNGYESLIYIGWTTTLAGLIFARKSYGGLAATTVLAATIMMVAGLSWLDPEITPLVPVLKSYWLTIHVSLEAGSYGFLVLGAIIGVLNLIFMIFANKKNGENVYRIIKEMSMISEMTLIGGLFMVSVGTYLGGVWANESWGRYWGWDAKETWALVTILVYSFILHMRFIPGLRGFYAFNVATLFGWASVAMTYFGVNYYLSGLHSYAAGDPVPVPSFVYYIVGALVVISLLAKWRSLAYQKIVKK
ncbi:MAG: cytochrome c biogenesis protein CcsA [Saprospiraceae bacterium]|nr:cytochrome c biogenesis protein CcsA [Saprospiraceae bacterium]